jgi:hypothetical protein
LLLDLITGTRVLGLEEIAAPRVEVGPRNACGRSRQVSNSDRSRRIQDGVGPLEAVTRIRPQLIPADQIIHDTVKQHDAPTEGRCDPRLAFSPRRATRVHCIPSDGVSPVV